MENYNFISHKQKVNTGEKVLLYVILEDGGNFNKNCFL